MKLILILLLSFSAFAQRVDVLKELAGVHKDYPMASWEMAPNEALKQPLEHLTGARKPMGWEMSVPYRNPEAARAALPEEYDSRKELGAVAPPIKDQGQCGSCWAFGTVAAFEYAYAKSTGKLKQFSEQELVSCSSDGSCGGGWFASDYHVKPGAALGSDFPYVARDVRCKSGLKQSEHLASFAALGSSNKKPSVDQIKQAIMASGSVAVTVTANRAMQAYSSGVFAGCSSATTNHIVALVGWGKGYWIMRNSWSKSWGEQGFMRIKFGCSRVGESAVYVVYKPSGK